MRNCVPVATLIVAPVETCIIDSLQNAILPDVASDWTTIDSPTPTLTCFGVLKNTLCEELWSFDNAVAKPLTQLNLNHHH